MPTPTFGHTSAAWTAGASFDPTCQSLQKSSTTNFCLIIMGNTTNLDNHGDVSSSPLFLAANDTSARLSETSNTSNLRRSPRDDVSVKRPVTERTKIITRPKKPRTISFAEQQRLNGRKQVQEAIKRKASNRARFLQENADCLKPFRGIVPNSTMLDEEHQDIHHQTRYTQPESIQADLREYQLAGLNWMSKMHDRGVGFILGDEMGLGKTIQTLTLICHLKESKSNTNLCPNLIVCPMSVLDSWVKEIKKWAPTLKHILFHSSYTEQTDNTNFFNVDVVVTTYEMIKAPALKSMWQRMSFQLVVLDEGHRIKSLKTETSQAVRKIKSENRVILTGTPVANNLEEVYCLLNYLLPDVFQDPTPFQEAFDLVHNKVDSKKLDDAHELVKVFMLRRLKSEVEALMPKKIETKICCPLSETQIWLYKALLLKDIELLSNVSSRSTKYLSNLIMELRKVCIHPYLFPGAEEDDSLTSLEDLVGASGKLAVLDMLLRSLYQKKHRVVLFSQFTSVLDILEDYCERRGWNFCRFDGSTSRAERNFVVNSFNEESSNKFIFLMSTRSGGMGLNLQTADTCILFDSDWNPQPDIQAMARVHRIGQKKTVHVYRLVTEGTVEDRMVKRAEKKLFLDCMVTKNGARTETGLGEDCESLISTLKFGCNAVFGHNSKANSLPTNEDIEIITDRNRTEDFSHGKLQGNADESTATFDATSDFAPTTDFAGIDFEKLRKSHKQEPCQISGAKKCALGSSVVFALHAEEESDRMDDGIVAAPTKKTGPGFEMQDWCQFCGDGGDLVGCPRCPISVHLECAEICQAHEFTSCWHHSCSVCDKNLIRAGGFLYACHSCPNAYCEDHIPKGFRVLEQNEQMEELNYEIKNGVYIFCSDQCEEVATNDFGWTPPDHHRQPCPPSIEISAYFGGHEIEHADCGEGR